MFADDELPSEICHICAHQVEKSFQFRTICENSDAALRLQLNQNDILQQDVSNDNPQLESSDLQNEWPDKKDNLVKSGVLCFLENKICKSEESSSGVFICFVCSYTFTAYDLLIEHLGKSHSNVTLYPCKECKLHFTDLNDYRMHLNMKHALNCSKCDHVFKHQKNLEMHLKSHLHEVFTCQYCKKLFDKQYELKQHELSHLDKLCRFCCKIFSTKEEYCEHIKSCTESYRCKFCNQRFHLKKDLIEHVNNLHENSSAPKCQNCEMAFNNWEEFQQHNCEQFTEKNLECQHCQQTFSEMSQLECHISAEHSGELLVCKFCAKSFTLKSALRRHEKSHSGVKPYQCKYCPRKFKDNSTCIVHIRTHTGEHPFQCPECHKDFKQLANLKVHTYRHHKVNRKMSEEKVEMIRSTTQQIYDQLYSTSVIDGYATDGSKNFQDIESNIGTPFSESANVLLTEHN